MNGKTRALSIKSRLDLDPLWWIKVALGVLVIGCFGFCIDKPSFNSRVAGLARDGVLLLPRHTPLYPLEHWRSWEIGAVVWSILFGGYYFLRFPPVKNQTAAKAIYALVGLGAIIPNSIAAILILRMQPARLHVIAVIVGGALFMVADFLLYRELKNDGDLRKSGSFFESLLLADAPMVVGLSILFFYIYLHPNREGTEPFVGGAITFQLLASNVTFILSQGGFIRWLWEEHLGYSKGPEGSLDRNPWAAAALMFALLGWIVLLLRLVNDNLSPWLGLIGLIAALAFGAGGLRAARRLAKAGRENIGQDAALTALALSIAGLLSSGLFTPQGRVFSTAGLTGFSVESGGERVKSVALSPDGFTLARGSDTLPTLVFFKQGKLEWSSTNDSSDPILALTFSADGKTLASGGEHLKVTLWDRDTKQSILLTPDRSDYHGTAEEPDVLCLSFSLDGDTLAAGMSDGTIQLWGTTPKDRRAKKVLKGKHNGAVRALAFSTNGKWLISGDEMGKVVQWDISKEWLMEDGSDERVLFDVHLVDSHVFVCQTENIDYRVDSVAVSQEGSVMAAGLHNGMVCKWELTKPNAPAKVMPGDDHEGDRPILALLFSDDARLLAGASKASLFLWDVPAEKLARSLSKKEAATAMAFSRGGERLASGADIGTLTIWRTQ